jgi:plastocyanin
MKKLLVVLAILFIGILLAGCTSQPATPVATPTPTAAPSTVVTTVPATAVPTVVVTVNVTQNATPNATPTATPTPRPTVTITFTQDMTISPDPTVIVKAGTTVIWKNMDPLKPHAIAPANVQSNAYFGGSGVGVQIPYGKTFEVTFDKVGAYDYTTVFQPEVQAKIIVVA